MSIKEKLEMDVDMKVRCALYEFERVHGIRPNRINMGYHLSDKLLNQFYWNCIPVQTLEEAAAKRNMELRYEYQGIPVKIDYKNPELLEVGYMVKWLENNN